jgi:hypothetical protein
MTVLGLALTSPSAGAATTATVGQLFAPNRNCNGPYTYLQTGVSSGNSYVVPAAGTITSWSFQDGAMPVTDLKLKVGRPAGGDNYTIIAESSAPSQTPNAVNTYPANIPVQANDVIGMTQNGGDCAITGQPSDTFVAFAADVPPGSSPTAFTPAAGIRFPVQATVTLPAPSNQFTIGKLKRNRHKGTAILPVSVPDPGTLTLTGRGVKTQRTAPAARAITSKAVAAAGTVKLLIKAKGKAKHKLGKTGKVKAKVNVTFTPTGGVSNTQSKRVKLIKDH